MDSEGCISSLGIELENTDGGLNQGVGKLAKIIRVGTDSHEPESDTIEELPVVELKNVFLGTLLHTVFEMDSYVSNISETNNVGKIFIDSSDFNLEMRVRC